MTISSVKVRSYKFVARVYGKAHFPLRWRISLYKKAYIETFRGKVKKCLRLLKPVR